MAAWRFAAVALIPPRAAKWPWAWIVSASAVVRNSRATFGKPSASAFFANARYFRLAWLSPAKASLRFSGVLAMGSPPCLGAGWVGLARPGPAGPSLLSVRQP